MLSNHHLNEFMDLLTGRLMDGSEGDDDSENMVAMYLKKKAKKFVRQQEKELEREATEAQTVVSLNQV
mgnify:FL=1|jgi:hypothetical protein